jgi:hypothetical protein
VGRLRGQAPVKPLPVALDASDEVPDRHAQPMQQAQPSQPESNEVREASE